MSGVDIAGLVEEWRKAMGGVTPGPWAAFTDDSGSKPHTNIVAVVPVTACVVALPGRNKREADIDWIARCSPARISALLDALLAQAAELAEAQKGLDLLAKHNAEIEAEHEATFDQFETATRQRDEALAALKASEEREAGLREALRWYAGDGSTYDGIDVGQRARRALALTEKVNG